VLLFVGSSASLLLYPSLFSATPDARPGDVADLNAWLDLPASLVALVVTLRPSAGHSFLGRTAEIDWRASSLFRTPPNTVQVYRPPVLFFGLLAGLYSVVALFSPISAVLYLFMGQASWHALAQGGLRPLVAWALLARLVRAI